MGCTLQKETQVEENADAAAQNGGGGREMDDTDTAVSGLPFKGKVADAIRQSGESGGS